MIVVKFSDDIFRYLDSLYTMGRRVVHTAIAGPHSTVEGHNYQPAQRL